MQNVLATSRLRLVVQNATSAIVATRNCCVCPPRHDYGEKRLSASPDHEVCRTARSAAFRVANLRVAENLCCFPSLLRDTTSSCSSISGAPPEIARATLRRLRLVPSRRPTCDLPTCHPDLQGPCSCAASAVASAIVNTSCSRERFRSQLC